MAAKPGTLEQLLTELAAVLGTVSTQFHPERYRATLVQLGIVMPEEILTSSDFESARQALVSAAKALEPAAENLLTAIQNEDYPAIASAVSAVIAAIGDLYSAINSFVTLIQGVIATLSAAAQAQIAALLPTLPRRLIDLALVTQIDQFPGLAASLTLLGIVERTPVVDAPDYQQVSLHPERLLRLLSDPAQQFETQYEWGLNSFDGSQLFPLLQQSMDLLNLPSRLVPATPGNPPTLEAFAVDLYPSSDLPPGLVVEAVMPLNGELDQQLPLPHPAWSVALHAAAELQIGGQLKLLPPLQLDIAPPSGQFTGLFSATLRGAPQSPFVLFGRAGGSRLEIGGVEIAAGADFSWSSASGSAQAIPFLRGDLSDGKVVINGDGGDALIDELLSGVEIESNFALGFGWDLQRGLQFHGAAGLRLDLPAHKRIGPLRLDTLHLGLALAESGFDLDLAATLGAELGPLQVTVERMGLRGQLTLPESSGNLGPLQLDIDFLAPAGVGVAMDTPTVKLGGFLSIDSANHRYVGAVEISIADSFDLTAIGLINTRFPDGSSGFSLLFMINTRFPSPIPLGYNFYLSGVGGLLGLHRSVDIDRLRSGLQHGAVDKILFPENVVQNMNALVTDLREIFPARRDQFLVGPMAELSWNTPALITAEVGLIIEFDNPVRIAILGVLRAAVPSPKEAVVDLKVNFLGSIDFDRGLLAFDASIYDSYIGYGSFRIGLEGDIALRISWGAKPDFVTSIGGFHPAYKPPTHLSLPVMRRLTLSLLKGNPRLTLTCYFALTTNTVQFGAEIDFYFGVSGFKVVGNFGFDVLFQFSPFRFIADVRASLAVKSGSTTILSLGLSFQLAGTSPWSAKGSASFKVLFFKVKVRFSTTWGERKEINLPKIDLLPLMLEEFERNSNWSALLSDLVGQQVKILPTALAADGLLFDPAGSLNISQNIAPLATPLSRFGNNGIADITAIDVDTVQVGSKSLNLSGVEEQFAPAAFQQLADADKLKAPSYEPQKSGVATAGVEQLQTDYLLARPVRYEEIVSDAEHIERNQRGGNLLLFNHLAGGGAAGRSSFSQQRLRRQQARSLLDINADSEKFAVVSSSTLAAAVNEAGESVNLTRTQAEQRLRALIEAGGDPAEFDIVPAFQMAV